MRFARIFSAVLLLGASAVSAQVVSASRSEGLPVADNTYGTSALTWVTFTPWDFHPVDTTTTYGYAPGTPTLGIYRTGGTNWFEAGLHLPEGAVVSVIEIAACDTNATLYLDVYFQAVLKTGAVLSMPPGIAYTTAASGCQVVSNSGGPFTWTVNNATTYYTVEADFHGAVGSTLVLNSVRVGYKLQVSPAPTTARFTDVPTNHVFFQYIEALAASGITSGCTASTFCPDAPLTRGQMAVFLARALGLHWTP